MVAIWNTIRGYDNILSDWTEKERVPGRAATIWLCRRKMHVKIGKNYPAEK